MVFQHCTINYCLFVANKIDKLCNNKNGRTPLNRRKKIIKNNRHVNLLQDRYTQRLKV